MLHQFFSFLTLTLALATPIISHTGTATTDVQSSEPLKDLFARQQAQPALLCSKACIDEVSASMGFSPPVWTSLSPGPIPACNSGPDPRSLFISLYNACDRARCFTSGFIPGENICPPIEENLPTPTSRCSHCPSPKPRPYKS